MLPVFNRRSSLPSFVDEFFGMDMVSNFLNDYQTGINIPAVNIIEGKEDFRIEVAAPGLDKNDFSIDVKNNMLFISCEKEEKREDENEKIMRREFSYSSFSRSFSLPNTVNTDKISAKHRDGVLTISIPKRDEAKERPPKKIAIA